MRTREATYADYGFKEGEDRQLKQYCLDLELPVSYCCYSVRMKIPYG